MNKYLLLSGLFLLICVPCFAQSQVGNAGLHTDIPKETHVKLVNALDTLFLHIHAGLPIDGEIDPVAFDRSFFDSFKQIETDTPKMQPQLIDLYPVDGGKYFISLAFIHQNSLKNIFNIIAATNGDKVIFSMPLKYFTRNWKIAIVGNVTYYYADSINLARAKQFNKTNTRIATKLGLQPGQLTFYLCTNHQEAYHLMGYEYDYNSAGNFRDGYGVDNGVIFSVMHNEDFSHDLFHYYSAKYRKHPRNSAADEGVAYSWGNAYYTDEHGEMITPKQLMPQLKEYLQQHPDTSLLELFTKNPLIFGPTAKVRSLLSSIICDEIERQKGVDGIKMLIDCDRGDDNYFRVTNELIGINRSNFDEKVKQLIDNYR